MSSDDARPRAKLPLHSKILIGLAVGAVGGLTARQILPTEASSDWTLTVPRLVALVEPIE